MRTHLTTGLGLALLVVLGSADAFAKEGSPCPQLVIAPSHVEAQMPLSVGGIAFQQKVISPGGALISEMALPTLYGPAPGTALVPFTTVDAGRPGWVLLKPNDGLLQGTYTVKEGKLPCTDGTTTEPSTTVTVGPQAAFPIEIGTVRIGDSIVGAPPNGAKKSFDAVTVYVKPSKEMEPFVSVAAWRATAISPEGVPHASVWLDYGTDTRPAGVPNAEISLSASAFCPAKGPQKLEVEAAIPGQPTIKTTSSWDVGELVCGQPGPQGQDPATPATTTTTTTSSPSDNNGEGCACETSIGSARSGGAGAWVLAIVLAGLSTRRRQRHRHHQA